MKQEPACIKNNREGFEYFTTPPNLQGIFILNIRCINIYIDGQEIKTENIWIGKNNIEIPIEHLCIIGNEFWDAKEKVKIIVRNSNSLPYGNHDVDLKFTCLESDHNSPAMYHELIISQIGTYIVENCYVD